MLSTVIIVFIGPISNKIRRHQFYSDSSHKPEVNLRANSGNYGK